MEKISEQKSYLRGKMAVKYFASAKPQRRALLDDRNYSNGHGGYVSKKTLAFLSFQNSQTVSSS
jgi:hypothetical protein